jgi:hypothetical protein
MAPLPPSADTLSSQSMLPSKQECPNLGHLRLGWICDIEWTGAAVSRSKRGGTMRDHRWPSVLIALLACGLIASCGSDDDPATSGDGTGANSSSDEFLDACYADIEGTPDEEKIGKPACQVAADSLDTCTEQAEALPEDAGREDAIKACDVAAEKAIAGVSGGG